LETSIEFTSYLCVVVDTPNTSDNLESNSNDVISPSQQTLTTVEPNGGDRTASYSSGERIDSLGDKSEAALKRAAEKIINYDMTPVAQALARHLGIDLTCDGVQARNRRGISIIVHGPPGSGKSMKALSIIE
jgi:hypothetical protein